MPLNQQLVGQSNQKGFTPMGEKHLIKSDVSGLIPCQLSGKSIIVPTVALVRPRTLARYLARCESEGILVALPKGIERPPLPAVLPLPPALVQLTRKSTARAIISLNTGLLYGSIQVAARAHNLSGALISAHLRGSTHHAKGRRFRYATPDEIVRYDQNPSAWQLGEELLPIIKEGSRKL